MNDSFLDYYKTILQKVSFDQALFQKEFRKALSNLDPKDGAQLKNWLISRGLLASTEPVRSFMRTAPNAMAQATSGS
jgi:hypothetical protein